MAAALTVGITACVDRDFEDEFDETPIRFSAQQSFSATRAVTTNVQDALFDEDAEINIFLKASIDGGTNWDEKIYDKNGDEISSPIVYKALASAGTTNQLTPKQGISKQPYYPLNPVSGSASDVKAKIFAAYPTTVTASTSVFTVESDQTTAANYKASDLMLVKPFTHDKNKEVVTLPFKHKMAKLIINAIADDGVTIDDVITIGDIYGSVKMDFENGDLDYGEGGWLNEKSLPVVCDTEGKTPNENAATSTITMLNGGAMVFPAQNIASASNFIRITGKDANGQEQAALFGIIDKTFYEGRVYKLNIHIGSVNFTPENNGDPHFIVITGWSEEYDELTLTPAQGYKSVRIADIDGNITDQNSTSGAFQEVFEDEVSKGNYYVYSRDEHNNPVECCPTPKVFYGDTAEEEIELTEGTDFRYVYVDNKRAGNKAQVMVVGAGNYVGLAALKPFTIMRAKGKITFPENSDKTGENAVVFNLDENIGFIKANNTGDGVVTYSVVADGEGEDAECVSVDPVDGYVVLQKVGKCTIKATAVSGRNYDYPEPDNTCTYKVEIKAKEVKLGPLTVTYSPTSFTFDDTEKKLTTLVVADGEHTLAEGVDYDYTFKTDDGTSAPVHQGTYKLIIKGKGNYDKTTKIEIPITVEKAKPTLTMAKDRKKYLWIGKYSPSEPEERRTTRAVTTEDWASGSLWYESENTEVATVNRTSGLITGVAAGETFIVVHVDADASENQDYLAADTIKFPVKVVEADFDFKLTRESSTVYEEQPLKRDANGVPIGAHTEWKCPAKGTWRLECYGAQGADTPKWRNTDGKIGSGTLYEARGSGGKGAHIAGDVELDRDKKLYVNVGEKGRNVLTGATRNTTQVPHGYYELDGFAWNGGGNVVWGGFVMMDNNGGTILPYNTDNFSARTYSASDNHSYPRNVVQDVISGGGGATDISLSWGTYSYSDKMKINNSSIKQAFYDWKSAAHLYSRIIVAGGGGGAIYYKGEGGYGSGGNGGAFTGGNGNWNDWGEGGQMDRGGYGGYGLQGWKKSPNNSTTSWNGGTTRHHHIVYLDGPFAGGFSCSDGMFGEGGNYTQTRQGCGAGGGGWYGGGSGGEQSSNGSGGGGSSFLWSTEKVTKSTSGGSAVVEMHTLYDTIETDWNNYLEYLAGNSNSGNWAYENTSFSAQFGAISNFQKYMPTTDKNHSVRKGNNNYMELIKKVTADPGVNPGDGWARITLVKIDEDQE